MNRIALLKKPWQQERPLSFNRGPCPRGQWLLVDRKTSRLVCRLTGCPLVDQIMYGGVCVKLGLKDDCQARIANHYE
jgi:hypothetical protein